MLKVTEPSSYRIILTSETFKYKTSNSTLKVSNRISKNAVICVTLKNYLKSAGNQLNFRVLANFNFVCLRTFFEEEAYETSVCRRTHFK